MADNLKIIITVEDKDLVRSLKRTDALESGINKLSGALVKGRITYAKYNKGVAELAVASSRSKKELLAYGKSLRRTEKSTNDAKVATKALAAAKRKAADADRNLAAQNKKSIADTKLLAAEEERLKQKFVAGHSAMNIYTKELNDLGIARQRGIITTEQQTAAIARLNAQMAAGTGAFAGQAAAIGNTRNRMNGMNMAVQQAGYQFGDFAVQVQGGTSAFTAFSQQGSQLAGILPMIAGPLGMSMKVAVGLAAALSVLIPVGSAVGRMFFEMRDSAKAANDEAKNLKTTMEGLTESFETKMLMLRFGVDTEAEAKLQDQLFALYKNDRRIRNEMRDTDSLSTRQRLSEELKANRVILSPILAMVNLLAKKREEYERIAELTKSEVTEVENLRANERRRSQERQAADLARKEAEKEYKELVNGVVKSQKDQLDVAKSIFRFGKDHVNVARLIAEQNGISLGLKGKELSIYISEAMILRRVKLLTEEAADATLESAKAAERFASALESAALAGQTLASLKFEFSAGGKAMSLYAGRGTTSDKPIEGDLPEGYGDKPKKNGGSSKVIDINDIITARKAQADQERILLGLSGEEQDAQRIYFQLQKQNEKATIQTSDIKLQGYAKEIAAQREQNRVIEEAAKQQAQLADFIGSSMETAMMSIVDSTISVEDAFKSMAASIIKELYRVLVVQKIVAAAKAFLGFADGGVVQQGAPTTSLRPMARPQANGGVFTKVNAYANGGVVSSPTTFPMSGNQTGLMGEAGAEAIMPLKRGRNGKLGVQAEGNGSGDVININQSFNFQANGDDSVKKLIAQAAPKIAELAKASVIDSRRRGGSTKAAFG